MTQADQRLVTLRRALHQNATLSNDEASSTAMVSAFISAFQPDELIQGLGGNGLAAIWRGEAAGPVVLVRAELDALPIPESIVLDHGSRTEGVSHKCGHDGHMAMVAGLAPWLVAERPGGAVVLLFQPAEETGEGARRVLDDERFAPIQPDWVFALHNLPGYPLGSVIVREGAFAAASKGLRVDFEGSTAHAAEPHLGRSPALAVAQLVQSLSSLPQVLTGLDEAAQVTVVHAWVGELAFGTSPGRGRVAATLRSHTQATMEKLSQRCLELVRGLAESWNLSHHEHWTEEFPATINHPAAAKVVRAAATKLGLELLTAAGPFAWSEDFGHLTSAFRGALFGLGAGSEQAALHHPSYDFPDELLPIGCELLTAVVREAALA